MAQLICFACQQTKKRGPDVRGKGFPQTQAHLNDLPSPDVAGGDPRYDDVQYRRGCHILRLRSGEAACGGRDPRTIRQRSTSIPQKTGRAVAFEII